jgi:hypothetical protein
MANQWQGDDQADVIQLAGLVATIDDIGDVVTYR